MDRRGAVDLHHVVDAVGGAYVDLIGRAGRLGIIAVDGQGSEAARSDLPWIIAGPTEPLPMSVAIGLTVMAEVMEPGTLSVPFATKVGPE